MKLSEKKCVPCEGGVPKLDASEINELSASIHPEWQVVDNTKLERSFQFVNFRHTMDFVNQVAAIANDENHHPVMHVEYSKVVLDLWTHAIGGLSENDFILAAKVDQL